jgi:ubiquinone/menaquinone biosynthesis C-methylase UbiE
MAERQDDVRKHYAIPEMAAKVIAALESLGIDPTQLKAEQLYPMDQLHGRNIDATREHVARLNLTPRDQVLDVGSGVGGPARYIAATTGAKVTGIDLTAEFVATARDLTRRCGREGQVSFQEGDALAMPFPDLTFDAALCLYVAMNIEAKVQLASEIARVLKPGGRLVWSEVVLGEGGAPEFPLPWAREPAFSFLMTGGALREAVESSGLKIVEWIDERKVIADWIRQQQQAAAGRQQSAGPLPAGPSPHDMLMGEGFPERRKNYARNLAEGRIGSIALVAHKPR